jgi:acyl carrier protein
MQDDTFLAQTIQDQVEALIIRTLRLGELGVSEIDPQVPLFGEGLGLDSIDALELAMAISKEFGIRLSSDDPQIQQIFSSLGSLTSFIAAQQITHQGS